MSFKFTQQSIPEVILISTEVFRDDRGSFFEFYKNSDFSGAGIQQSFSQDNVSSSKKGVIRGLHFQRPPKDQGKLVSVIKGEIYDVAVDIRPSSPTFSKYVGIHLNAEAPNMIYLPPGFAHGFCAITDALVLYKCTKEYSPELDDGIIYNDSDIGIDWPISNPLVSPKDSKLPFFKDLYKKQ